jgi:hypothetical protein
MRKILWLTVTLIVLVSLIGCGAKEEQRLAGDAPITTIGRGEVAEATPSLEPEQSNKGVCPPNAAIDWVDILMINDIKYYGIRDGSSETGEASDNQIGDKVGVVAYMLSDNACSNHKTVNGDAAFLPIGTEIRELKGYKPEYRVVADHHIYEAKENPNAKTVGDLLDIEGKVDHISFESKIDGSHVSDFDAESSSAFVEELLSLPYVSFDILYKKLPQGGQDLQFMRVHLKDGTSFRMVYYLDSNIVNPSAMGSDKLKEIVLSQLKSSGSSQSGAEADSTGTRIIKPDADAPKLSASELESIQNKLTDRLDQIKQDSSIAIQASGAGLDSITLMIRSYGDVEYRLTDSDIADFKKYLYDIAGEKFPMDITIMDCCLGTGIVGTIQDYDSASNRILVYSENKKDGENDNSFSNLVSLEKDGRVYVGDGEPSTKFDESLVGSQVSYWTTGLVLTSDPGQVSALKVVVE